MIITLSGPYPGFKEQNFIREAVLNGGVICYPTDTVYGIGCSINHQNSIAKVYQMKFRHKNMENKSLSLIFKDISQISDYAVLDDMQFRILKKYLPGPYTFILPARKTLPKNLFDGKKKTIGVRIPNHPICDLLLEISQSPFVTTSLSGIDGNVLNDTFKIGDMCKGIIDLIIDVGPLYRLPSTVIDLTGEHPEVLREGEGIEHWRE